MITIALPWPPSVNTYWRHIAKGPLAGRVLVSQEGRDYRAAVIRCIASQPFAAALEQRLRVDIEVQMPDRRRRDLDNLPKAVLDALTQAGVWKDDSQIDDLRVWRAGPLVAGGRIVVRIEDAVAVAGTQVDLLEIAA